MSNLAQTLQTVLDDAARDPMVPGVMAAVLAPRQDCDWQGASGRDRRAGGESLSADQPLRIASVTKMFVAAAVLRLAEDDCLDLDRGVSTLLSETSVATLTAAGYEPLLMTSTQLLCHTSGLQDHVASPDYVTAVLANPKKQWTRHEQLILAMEMGPPLGAPAEVFRYSDTGYVLIGEIIERIMGQTVGPACRSLLGFESLGLARTWWEGSESSRDGDRRRVHQYLEEVDTSGFDPSFDLFGGGGLISTVNDLAHFVRALFRGELFRRCGTLAAALLVPPAERPAGAHLHSSLGMVVPMTPLAGWGHAGFWGCIAATCTERDISVAVSVNQNAPADPLLLWKLASRLANAANAAGQRA